MKQNEESNVRIANPPSKMDVFEYAKHKVKYFEDYGYADFCDCGRDSFVCQTCGKVKCSIHLADGKVNDKNACTDCYFKAKTMNKVWSPSPGNTAYDLMC